MLNKTITWLLVGGLLAGAILIWLLPPGESIAETQEIFAEAPWLVGSMESPFAYGGSPATLRIEGSALLRWDLAELSLEIQVALPVVPELLQASSGETEVADDGPRTLTIELFEPMDSWSNQAILGDTGRGDTRLPETLCAIAGAGSFRVQLEDARRESVWFGLWALADALRKDDGAIRKQGLVFSPMLRDRAGFSDPDRQELTLLLYTEETFDADVVLQLVFPEIEVRFSN